MKLWKSIDATIQKIAKWSLLIAVICIVFMMVLATLDIITTKFFNHPIPGTTEIIEDLNIPLVFLGMAYVQLTSGHIAGPVFEKRFSKSVNNAIKIAGCVLGILGCGFVAWRTLILLQTMILTQETKIGAVEFVLWPFALIILWSFVLQVIAFIPSIVRILTQSEPSSSEVQEEKRAF